MKNQELFIGIDVSNKALDICELQAGSKVYKLANTTKSITKWINEVKSDHANCTVYVCLENTGKYSWRLVEALSDTLFKVYVVNPLHLKRSLGLIRGKDDRIDAIRIAKFIQKNHSDLAEHVVEREQITSLKVLLTERRYKVLSRGQLKTKNKDLKQLSNKKLATKLIKKNLLLIKQITGQINDLEAEIRLLITRDERLTQLTTLLKSIPGVGEILTWNLLVKTNEFKAIKSPRKLACYCGVAPFENRSGTSVFGKTRVSLLADKKLKKVLHLAAMRAVRIQNSFKEYYDRKVAEGKNKMSVLNAVRNKILHVVYAVIKNQETYKYRLDLS